MVQALEIERLAAGLGQAPERRGAAPRLRGAALFAGGTGGHVMPAIALARCIRARHPGCRITLVRTRRAIEDRLVAPGEFETAVLDLDPPGARLGGKVRFARQCLRAMAAARAQLARAGAEVAVGLGGYAAVPGILAARIDGIPVVLCEQNLRPGKVNRLLGPLAEWVACPETVTEENFGFWRGLVRVRVTGNPLRAEVAQAREWRRSLGPQRRRQELGGDGRRILLIMGGSQGARAINRAVVDALPRLARYRDGIFCIHLAGEADNEWVRESYRRAGWSARVSGYEPDLPRLLAGADLVLARAGGTSIAELAAIGVPAVLVPYPGHGDRHQFANTRVLAERGAARVIDEPSLDGALIEEIAGELFRDDRLEAMGRAALACGRIDGAERVVDLLESVVSSRRGESIGSARGAPAPERLAE